mmetsp:Transcript_27456/g.77965  ORF Transcript_27456/g.77965 Transcript_27456/m.77965 type:complete len:130 (-) Transcript_27456:2238-2627(-)
MLPLGAAGMVTKRCTTCCCMSTGPATATAGVDRCRIAIALGATTVVTDGAAMGIGRSSDPPETTGGRVAAGVLGSPMAAGAAADRGADLSAKPSGPRVDADPKAQEHTEVLRAAVARAVVGVTGRSPPT